MQRKKKIILAFSGIAIIGVNVLLKNYPQFVEVYYSNGLYIWISQLMRYSFGWISISVGDLFYTLAGLYVLRWLIKNRGRIIKDTKNCVLEVFTALSFAYIAFHILWAFNYYRQPLYITLDLDKDYSTQQLSDVIDYLISQTNLTHSKLNSVDSVKIDFPFTKTEILNRIPQGYKELQKEFSQLEYNQPSIKPSLYSTALTYMGFSGYLNPFTNEAQVDILIPKFKLPTTGSHEVAHQLGFAAENEANFIGGLAAIQNPDPYFQYSGYAFALRHCLYELYKRDEANYEEKRAKINVGVLKNYKETQDFWRSYQNPIEPLFKTTYDGFLKANNQSKGIESYSYVVALFVNYFESDLMLNKR